ncbi:MAG: DNA replication/repair protein RecF, partial [Gemmatimonadota bacterium]
MHGAAHAPPEADRETRWASVGCLELRDFRNFRGLRCDFPATGVAIVGPNGSGKTNLLEAIYYLQIFRSFRGAADSELVRFGGEVFRISGEVKGTGDRRELTAAYGRAERRKKVTIDGAEVGRLVEAIGALGAVVFSPDDAEIVRGSPARRRRFLDIVLSLMEPGYVSSLQRFRAVLAQRNEALRSQAARSVVEAWTDGLVEWGSRVMASRARWVARQRERYRGYHATISGGGRGEPIYEPGLGRRPPDRGGEDAGADAAEVREGELRESTEGWAERLRRALDGAAERERQ